MSVIRFVLGRIILFFDWLTRPKSPEHTPEVQAELDQKTSDLALYQYQACPFCVKARRVIRRLGLNIELRDASKNLQHKTDLASLGGKVQVPCLLIGKTSDNPQWLYESDAITRYLETHYSR